jgi:hypothetical protein
LHDSLSGPLADAPTENARATAALFPASNVEIRIVDLSEASRISSPRFDNVSANGCQFSVSVLQAPVAPAALADPLCGSDVLAPT